MRMAFLRAARRSARHCECHRPSRSLCHSGAGTLRLRNRDAKPLPETEGQRGRHSANDLASLGSTPLAWRRTSDPARLPTHADRACANDRDFSVDPRTRRASPTIRQLQGRTDSRLRGYGSSPCSSHATRPRVAQAEPHRPPSGVIPERWPRRWLADGERSSAASLGLAMPGLPRSVRERWDQTVGSGTNSRTS
jgi:hypothetical protein